MHPRRLQRENKNYSILIPSDRLRRGYLFLNNLKPPNAGKPDNIILRVFIVQPLIYRRQRYGNNSNLQLPGREK
jgi:hypothetical protein